MTIIHRRTAVVTLFSRRSGRPAGSASPGPAQRLTNPGRVTTLAVLTVVLLAPIAATGIVSAADGTGPTISVAVNGDRVADGERRVVETASFTVRVSDEVDLSTVVLRLDGEEYATLSPAGESLERTFDPDFPSTGTTVQVIATNENDVTATHRFTVYRDTVPPQIGLSSPFGVQTGHQFPDETARTNASISVRGTVEDVSGVTSFEASIIGGEQMTEAALSPNGTFAFSTTLGTGNNSLVISATDAYGNQRFVYTRIEITDESPPSIVVQDWPGNVTASDVITPTVVANDSVGVEAVTYDVEGQPERTLVKPVSSLFAADRTRIERRAEIQFYYPGTYNVTFNATDTANHSAQVTRTIEYDPVTPEEAAVPEIVRHANRSGMLDPTTYHLNATVRNGSVTRVVVESARNRTQRVLSYRIVYDGASRSTVGIDVTLSVARAANDVTIRATDRFGTQHVETFTVDARTAAALQTRTNTTTAGSTSTTAAGTAGSTTHTTTTSTTGGPSADPITSIDVVRETPITPQPTTVNSTPLLPWVFPLAMAIAFLFVRIRRG
ncbi:MAG: hypothetical protein ABEJ55_07710 [Halanaeroarchaeum sp.]